MNAGRGWMRWAMAVLAALLLFAFEAPSALATTASLGDSFSSGEGAGPYDAGTSFEHGNGCDRSGDAWPRLLGVPKANHFACSGATTLDFYEAKKENVSQLERLRALAAKEPISKVYVTIGGNDLGFGGVVRSCFEPRPGHTCLKQMDTHELPKLHDHVQPAVAKALSEAKVAAAGGQVIMVGYPDLIPGPGSSFVNCGWLSDVEKGRVWKLEAELDSALAQAAASAGVTYVSIREALKGHELCTKDSWVNPVGGLTDFASHRGRAPHFSPHQGHPNARGQQAMADGVRHAEDAGAGVVPLPPAGCTPAGNVAVIVDDSGSMLQNDPLNIRRSGVELLITKPTGQSRTLGAVEFGGEAGPLFAPGLVSANRTGMLGSLNALQDDGFDESGGDTDYNAAFAASGAEQPDAQARIFLTDGGHNVGPYENGHLGGPRTYVIGLNIGPAGEGNSEADLLGRIASDTGGYYFPLLRNPGDSAETQSKRIQPVFNAIDALLQCHGAPQQAVRKLVKPNVPAPPVSSSFAQAAGLEVVLSWATPNTQVGLASASVRNAGGRVIANLTGKRPRRHGRRSKGPAPSLLTPGLVSGPTFETITVPRPPHGASLQISVVATALPGPSSVSVQVSPLQTVPAGTPGAPPTPSAPPSSSPGGSGGSGSGPPPPPPPANHMEQETPNHPVNTFTNYHNASGMGPPIAAGQWVEVSCRVYDPTIASVNPDGYWYRIASSPWNNAYYSPANTFMNGDPYGGPYTHNTDFSVPVC
jgi:GDSL-like Lipase/Acylhydrolase family